MGRIALCLIEGARLIGGLFNTGLTVFSPSAVRIAYGLLRRICLLIIRMKTLTRMRALSSSSGQMNTKQTRLDQKERSTSPQVN